MKFWPYTHNLFDFLARYVNKNRLKKSSEKKKKFDDFILLRDLLFFEDARESLYFHKDTGSVFSIKTYKNAELFDFEKEIQKVKEIIEKNSNNTETNVEQTNSNSFY